MNPTEENNTSTDMFIGQKKVKDNESLDEKSPTGQDLFKVDYDDGTSEVLTRKMFEAIISNASVDPNNLLNIKTNAISVDVLKVLLDWGVTFQEIDYIFDKVTLSLNMNMEAATDKVFGKKKNELTLLDLDKILRVPKSAPEEKATVSDVIAPDSEQATS